MNMTVRDTMRSSLIRSRIHAFDWYQNYRPWITYNGRYAKIHVSLVNFSVRTVRYETYHTHILFFERYVYVR